MRQHNMTGPTPIRLRHGFLVLMTVLLGLVSGFTPMTSPGIAARQALYAMATHQSTTSEATTPATPSPILSATTSSNKETQLVHPTSDRNADDKKSSSNWRQEISTKISRWASKALRRPGVRFRVGLGVVTTVILSVSSTFPKASFLWKAVKTWMSHRGFQGISALGRSFAYGWAVLVAYPRMLDRRANERRRKEQEANLERRRYYLRQVAAEVVRLRQELASLDGEIRAFRREIISLKAYQNRNSNEETNQTNNDVELQEAIAGEMAHLARLREDTQAALLAARQTWSEVRAKSPPEAWGEDLLLWDNHSTPPKLP